MDYKSLIKAELQQFLEEKGPNNFVLAENLQCRGKDNVPFVTALNDLLAEGVIRAIQNNDGRIAIALNPTEASAITISKTGRARVFISYAHEDEKWLRRLAETLEVLEKQQIFDIWDDRKIGAGSDWQEQIIYALLNARVAILLVSSSFLRSEFILKTEVPTFLDAHLKTGMHIYPLLVRPCPFEEVSWLAKFQIRPCGARALSTYHAAKLDEVLTSVAREVGDLCRSSPQRNQA